MTQHQPATGVQHQSPNSAADSEVMGTIPVPHNEATVRNGESTVRKSEGTVRKGESTVRNGEDTVRKDEASEGQDAATVHKFNAVSMNNIGFTYDRGATWVVRHSSLNIQQGQYVAVVGRNGSGKSTLGRIIAGLVAPDEGTLHLYQHTVFDATSGGANSEAYREARHQIGVVFQQPDDQLVATVVEDDVAFGPENLGVDPYEIRERVTASLTQVDLLDRQHRDPLSMSGGQQQRVAIAGMLAMHARMIVLDEPCAMLDTQARQDVHRILQTLHAQGTTIVHITHSIEEALLADRILLMRDGRPQEISHHEAAAFFNADLEPQDSLEETASQASNTSAHTSEPSAADVASTDASTDIASTDVEPSTQSLWRSSAAPGTVVLEAQHLTYRFPNAPHPTIEDFSIQLRAGTITALQGVNGSGKTTLVRLLSDIVTPQSGSVTVCGLPLVRSLRGKSKRVKARARLAARQHIGYVMQHPEHQLFAETVAEDIAFGPRNQHLSAQEVQERVNDAMSLVGIAHLADRSPFSLSGGQQRLVAIAGILACHPDVVIWDEPTSSLDFFASMRIHHIMLALRERGIASLVITHHDDELALADHSITLHKISTSSSNNNPSLHNAHSLHDVDSARTTTTASAQTHTRPLFQLLDPRVALVGTLAIMLTSFAVNSPWALLITGIITAGLLITSRTNIKHLLITIHPFLILFAIMWVMNLWFTQDGTALWEFGFLRITDAGLWFATLYFCRFVAVIVIGAVLIRSTTTVALIDAMNSLLTPLAKLGVHTDELSLVASLALRFVPTLGIEARDIMNAQAARGGTIDSGSLPQRIRAMAAIIVPVFAGALRHADHLALALDARCYEGGTHRTHMRQMKLSWRDAVYAAVAALDIIAIIVLALLQL